MDLSQDILDQCHIRAVIIGIGGLSKAKLLEHVSLLRDCSLAISLTEFALNLATPQVTNAFPNLDVNQTIIRYDIVGVFSTTPKTSRKNKTSAGRKGAMQQRAPHPVRTRESNNGTDDHHARDGGDHGGGDDNGNDYDDKSDDDDEDVDDDDNDDDRSSVQREDADVDSGTRASDSGDTMEMAPIGNPASKPPAAHSRGKPNNVLIHSMEASSGAINTDYNDFQYSRRVLAVFGVIDCQKTTDLHSAYVEFQQVCAQFPSVLDVRCFAFEPKETQEDNEKHVILIPNQSREQLLFYVSTVMSDVTLSLIQLLAAAHQTRIYERDEKKSLPVVPFERPPGTDEAKFFNTNKKKVSGRLEKIVGDICLLVGSPDDALHHFTEAMEQTKSAGDWLYYGGSLEAMCACMLAKARLGDTLMVQDFTDKYTEAIASYGKVKGAGVIEIEAMFKFAKFFIARKMYHQASMILKDIPSVEVSLNDDEQIRLAAALVLMYQSIGFKRKASFFLRHLATLFSKGSNRTDLVVSHYVLLQSLPAHYLGGLLHFIRGDIDALASIYSDDPPSSTATPGRASSSSASLPSLDATVIPKKRVSKFRSATSLLSATTTGASTLLALASSSPVGPGHPLQSDKTLAAANIGWNELQVRLFRQLIFASKYINDPKKTVQYICFFLHQMHDTLSDSEQLELAYLLNNLTSRQQFTIGHLPFQKMPQVLRLFLNECPSHLKIHKRANPKQSAVKDVFIYSPFAKKNEQQRSTEPIFWTQGELIAVVVELGNPLAFPLFVESLTLSTSGTVFVGLPTSIAVPARTKSLQVTLFGKALAHGSLSIRGVSARIFNVNSEHLLPPIQVTVVPEVPVLEVSMNPNPSINNNAMCTFEGQRLEINVVFANTSSIPIDFIRIATDVQSQPGFFMETSPVAFPTTEDLLAKGLLPLLPGHHISMPLKVISQLGCAGVSVTLEYGSADVMDYYRQASLSVPLRASKLLDFSSFDIIPSSFVTKKVALTEDEKHVLSSASSYTALNTLQTSPPRKRLPTGTADSTSAVETIPLWIAVLKFSEQDSVSPENRFITSTLQSDDGSVCLLSVDVTNRCPEPLQLVFVAKEHQDDQPLCRISTSLNASSCQRMLLPFQRFKIPDHICEQDPPPKDPTKQFVVSNDKHKGKDEKLRENFLYWHQRKLHDLYTVEWLSNVRGLIKLDGLSLSLGMVSRLNPDVCRMALRVASGDSPTPRLKAHSFVPVEATMRNISNDAIVSIKSTLKCVLDLQNGHVTDGADGRVMWAGALTASKEKLGRGESFTHFIKLVFLAPGSYSLVCRVQAHYNTSYGVQTQLSEESAVVVVE